MTRLTVEQVSRESQTSDAASVTSLQLTHRALSDVSCLGAFQNLERLDLSCNCLSSLEGLSSCTNLKWLSVVENKLESLKGIERLPNLTVLNAGKNKLRTMNGIGSVTSLRALILNDNNISSISELHQLEKLNTLVLSRNPIHDIGDALVKAGSIEKLSLSHCHLETIGSSLKSCPHLKEARFSHNKIGALPTELARNTALKILDMGNNQLEKRSDLNVLSALHKLRNLNLQGNPVSETDNLVKKVKKLVPNLQIFNGKPIEKSNTRGNASKENLFSHSKDDSTVNNASDVEAEKRVERKKRKTEVKASGENLSEKSSKEAHKVASLTDADVAKRVERKKRKTEVNASRENLSEKSSKEAHKVASLTDAYVAKKKGRTKEVAGLDAKNDTDASAVKRTERKTENEQGKQIEGMDDAETPFMDLILSGNNLQGSDKKMDRVGADSKQYGVVVDHTAKKKKAKSIDTGNNAIELLSSVPEVGSGGPSTWD